MKGSQILINGVQPNGRFVAGIISGTPLPGMAMEMVPATEPIGGLFTYRAVSSQGVKENYFILLEDENQGCNVLTPMISGQVVRLYVPISGDELNLLVESESGTGHHYAIGDNLIVDNNGKFILTTGTPGRTPCTCEETAGAPLSADTLLACRWI